MMARHIRFHQADREELKRLSIESEQKIDALSDEELFLAEEELQASIRAILSRSGTPQTEIPRLQKIRSRNQNRSYWKAGSVIFLMAAAVLFTVKIDNASDENLDSYTGVKGLGNPASIACDAKPFQADGSNSASELGVYRIDASKPTFVKMRCGQPVFVHVGVKKGDHWVWLSRNQQLSQEGLLAKDLTPTRGSDVAILATEKAVPESDFEGASPSILLDRMRGTGYWSDEMKFDAL